MKLSKIQRSPLNWDLEKVLNHFKCKVQLRMLEKPKLSCDIDLIIIKVNREPSEKEIVEFSRNFYTAIIDHAGH